MDAPPKKGQKTDSMEPDVVPDLIDAVDGVSKLQSTTHAKSSMGHSTESGRDDNPESPASVFSRSSPT